MTISMVVGTLVIITAAVAAFAGEIDPNVLTVLSSLGAGLIFGPLIDRLAAR